MLRLLETARDTAAATLADMFWSVATSNLVLTAIGLAALACVIVSHVPLKWLPGIGDYLRLASALGYVTLSLFFLLAGFRLSDERAEAKRLREDLAWKTFQLEQQEATAQDAERLKVDAETAARDAKDKLDGFLRTYKPEGGRALTADDISRLCKLRRDPC